MLELLACEGHVVDVGRYAGILIGVKHGVDDLGGNLSTRCRIKHAVPMEVIDARKPIHQLVEGLVDERGLAEHGTNGHVAQANATLPATVADDRLGDHATWVGKVDEPSIGAKLLHLLDDVKDDGNGAQSLEHAAGTVGLLTEHAMGEGDALVLDACLKQAHAELCGNEVGILERLAAIERQMNLDVVTGGVPHALRHGTDDLKLLATALNVDQPYFLNRQTIIAGDEPIHEFGGVAAATANGADL